MPERVALVGMMAVGKSTVGRRVAEALGWRFLDSDDEVCARTGRSVREIFEAEGEAAYRRLETEVLLDALGSPDPVVVAAAGGVVLAEENRRLLRERATVVWLAADPAVLERRVAKGDHRPLLGDDPGPVLRRLAEERRPLYEEVADCRVDVEGGDPGDAAASVLRCLGRSS